MCGFVGIISRSDHREVLPRMLERIRHRGPDGDGQVFYAQNGWYVALGHRRLSIIDIEGGSQPMEVGSHALVYNGEIYNYRDLDAKAGGDTSALLNYMAEHGEAGIGDLNGMFAFAFWDHVQGSLLLARDRPGIKPLYYMPLPDGGIAFASELTALLEHPAASKRIDVRALSSYFFLDYAGAPESLVEGIHKLSPAHSLRWQNGKLDAPKRYWGLSSIKPARKAVPLWQHLQTVVRRDLIADVPVGVFLSGGIDSSIIATLAAEQSRDRLKAFSIGFENPAFDELDFAKLLAQHIEVEHVTRVFTERDLLAELDTILDALDEPLADPSFLPTYLLARLAAQEVKVVLGGDGGDELFGGYPTYAAHRLAYMYKAMPVWVRNHLILPAVAQLPLQDGYHGLEWKLKRFTKGFENDPTRRHLRWMSNLDLAELRKAIPNLLRDPLVLRMALVDGQNEDWVQQMMHLDFMTYLPGSVLAKVDRASMAHGLEVRPPFLDNEMVEVAYGIESRLKKDKAPLKAAARGHIPDVIIDRKKKGFAIPLAAWVRGPLLPRLERILKDSPVWRLELLSQDVFTEWLSEHRNRSFDRSRPLWALLVLDHWLVKEKF
ncbi:MAG: asparagine synthase (glutamine-hydrolyzing) [Myxococcota bacterium]